MLIETVEYFWGFECVNGMQYTQYSNVSVHSSMVSEFGGIARFCATPKIDGYPTVRLDVDGKIKRCFLFRLMTFGRYEDALYFRSPKEYIEYHKNKMSSHWCAGLIYPSHSEVAVIDTKQRCVWFKKMSTNPELELLRAPWQL